MLNRCRFRLFAMIIATGAAVFAWGAQSEIKPAVPHFVTSDRCAACHNKLATSSGEDLSHVPAWRPTLMANASRDPYWHASVRGETLNHPEAQSVIEDECSNCHMPMARFESKLAARDETIFSHLGFRPEDRGDSLAADGVSCTLCHQIGADKFGTRASYNGGFAIAGPTAEGERPAFGRYTPTANHIKLMLTATAGFRPVESEHLAKSEVCATCHTLFTKALGPDGKESGEFPEQVPYLEWLHSDYREKRSCQSCHMPVVEENVAISSIMGVPRSGVSRHAFLGGNFFMTGIFNRNHSELNVQALPEELAAAAQKITAYLQSEAARVSIGKLQIGDGRLETEVTVENLGGHKLPTAYPSRRVWIHFTVKDKDKRTVFESGAINPTGALIDNDNDTDPSRYEPHYAEITSAGQVQIYEAIMADNNGAVTTGLLKAVRYLKDNRLLPSGFDKKNAGKDVSVAGNAFEDADFIGGIDRVRYSVALGKAPGPFSIEAELCFQPIGYRWAMNLKAHNAEESRKFIRYYEAAAPFSMVVLAHTGANQ